MTASKKLISVISPTFNEAENISVLYERVNKVMSKYSQYDFEYLFIDNCSTDGTIFQLRHIAQLDKRVKVIINNRNFGHIRSPYWGILQTLGDAVVYLASDLQDPPELIESFIAKWQDGWPVVLAVKPTSKNNFMMNYFRKIYYRFLEKITDIPIVRDSTGFGIYDKKVIDELRKINDPYPYFRGLICELGFPITTIQFEQPRRFRGITKNNFYTLFDTAMLGMISHSKVPIRISMFLGIAIGLLSFAIAIFYTVMKLLYWDSFPIGVAPIAIGLFLFISLIFIFIGLLGEYIATILIYLQNRPIVIERERINFTQDDMRP